MRPNVNKPQYRVFYAAPLFGEEEAQAVQRVLEVGWLGQAHEVAQFEMELAGYIGKTYGISVNSGSSANLLAMLALGLPPGAEVIAPAMTFPTTFNPIYYARCVPVLVDVDLETYSITATALEEAISEKTRAIIFPHTLGIPANMPEIMNIATRHRLYVIEDTCDALGAEVGGRKAGSFGTLATFSFYASHHITAGGEGGMILTDEEALWSKINSLKAWGRPSDADIKERQADRLSFEIDGISYDYRYSYPELGFNLKMTEMQGAFGRVQLRKLPEFIAKRRENFQYFYNFIKANYEEFFILPKWTGGAKPSWFGFMLTIRDNAPFDRRSIITFLEENGIQIRLMFAGNIKRQPGYQNVDMRVVGNLENSDKIFRDTFWIGVHPGIRNDDREYVCEVFHNFFRKSLKLGSMPQ